MKGVFATSQNSRYIPSYPRGWNIFLIFHKFVAVSAEVILLCFPALLQLNLCCEALLIMNVLIPH